jgi:hypothetical protein
MRWTCTTVRYSLQWCTLTRPPLVKTHTSNPAFPTGGGLGGFVFFFACGGVERRGHPFRGGWSHSPPVGKGGDVDDDVLCAGGWVVAVLNVVAIPLGGDGPTLPLWGRVVTKMMMLLFFREGGFVLSFKWSFYDRFVLDGRDRCNTCGYIFEICTYGSTGGYDLLATAADAAAARCCCCSLLLLLAARCCC